MLIDHAISAEIYSSLESVADRCVLQLAIMSTDAAFIDIPDKDDNFSFTININDVEDLKFSGIVKEREFQKSLNGYFVTLHIYDKAVSLLDVHFNSSLAGSRDPDDECVDVTPENSGISVSDVLARVETNLTDAGVPADIVWRLPDYVIQESVTFRGPVIDVVRHFAEYFSISEIRKIVFYSDQLGNIVVDQLDLWEARIDGSLLEEKRLIDINIGETLLPKISKVLLTGGYKGASGVPRVLHTQSITEDKVSGITYDTDTYTSVNKNGRVFFVSSYTHVTAFHVDNFDDTMTDEVTYFNYTSKCGNILHQVATQVRTTRVKVDNVFAMDMYTQSVHYVTYHFNNEGRMLSQEDISIEYEEDGKKKKHTVENIRYVELSRGATQKTYTLQQGSRDKGLRLKSRTVEVFYGSAPEGVSGPGAPASASQIIRATQTVTGKVHDEVLEYSNPNIKGEEEFAPITGQVLEMHNATRVDITISMIGTPGIKKGGQYKIKDTRASSGDINFVAMEVTHALSVGSYFTTNIRGVCYE